MLLCVSPLLADLGLSFMLLCVSPLLADLGLSFMLLCVSPLLADLGLLMKCIMCTCLNTKDDSSDLYAELGLLMKSCIDQGQLVPDDVISRLILTEMRSIEQSSWLLDGKQ
jgi:hypothetical protein